MDGPTTTASTRNAHPERYATAPGAGSAHARYATARPPSSLLPCRPHTVARKAGAFLARDGIVLYDNPAAF
ncbi:hypothetical protein ACIGT4_03735 [Streptomyces sioyaensis]|uniref:hypothetical protein n=1 Tax=Streptomyces sioyaensis TaxID=67364 RepID=UPI0037D90D64